MGKTKSKTEKSKPTSRTKGSKKKSSKNEKSKPASQPKGMGFGVKKEPNDTFEYTGAMRPGTLSPRREVPERIQRPEYADSGQPYQVVGLEAKTEEEIKGMRVAGRIAREVLDAAGRAVAVGVTTDEIDAVVHEACIARDSYPSPLNYRKFPKSCCTSVNEIICHGIPSSYVLQDGDIINIDITIYHGGFHGDCSETFLVGDVDEAGKNLVKVTHDCWHEAIKYCAPGKVFKGIGSAIEDYIEPFGYSTSRVFIGHGIGRTFHTDPQVFHCRNNYPGKMQAGQTFTIEPMICEGTAKEKMWNDEWTAATEDGLRSAQFEHTLLITPDGVEALTARTPDSNKFWWEEGEVVLKPCETKR